MSIYGRPHTIRRCNPISEHDRQGYERLLRAIHTAQPQPEPADPSFVLGLMTWMIQNKPIEEAPAISPNSVVWDMVENDERKWN